MRLLVFIAVLLLSACAAQPQRSGISLPDEDSNKAVLPDRNTSRAVLSLLDKARAATSQGDYARAEVLLERTVRIEPNNASLWHYLAKLRLHQARLEEAIGLANKSNHLADNNHRLQADNWRIIAHARQRLGDQIGAQNAQQRANQLSGN